MGCGSSSQPSQPVEVPSGEGQTMAEKEPADKVTQGDVCSSDTVETFQNVTPSPTPTKMLLEKETLDGEEMPSPAAYKSDGAAERDPIMYNRDGGATSPSDAFQPQPRQQPTSPGYKLEDESRKIGGFDPEAFRKANQPKAQGFISQGSTSTHEPIDWSTPLPNSTGDRDSKKNSKARSGNAGQGYNASQNNNYYSGETNPTGGNSANKQWNQRDYIQSEDVFTTNSPQALQQNAPRLEFRDDPWRAPGGLGHDDSGNRRITREDDDLMDEIISELEDL